MSSNHKPTFVEKQQMIVLAFFFILKKPCLYKPWLRDTWKPINCIPLQKIKRTLGVFSKKGNFWLDKFRHTNRRDRYETCLLINSRVNSWFTLSNPAYWYLLSERHWWFISNWKGFSISSRCYLRCQTKLHLFPYLMSHLIIFHTANPQFHIQTRYPISDQNVEI